MNRGAVESRIPISVPSYGEAEIAEVMDSLISRKVTMGEKVARFERMWADYIGVPHAVMTNSGSSANLLALTAIMHRWGGYRREVITPALTWATSVFPIAQVGLVPILVDVDLETFNLSVEGVKAAVTDRTLAIMPVHLLGNPCAIDALQKICFEKGLFLIEDACEAHGAEYHGKKVGAFGDAATFSFFFSHHISTIEGGMVVTPHDFIAEHCRSLRAFGWIREMIQKKEIASAHPDIDPRFLFQFPGYNMRPTELQGAFGIHQVPRLEGFLAHRQMTSEYLNRELSRFPWIQLPVQMPETRHAWFTYPIVVRSGAPFACRELTHYLEEHGVETRPLEAGNMAIQPAMNRLSYRVSGSIANTEYLHCNGFFFGIHQGIGESEREYIVSCFQDFMHGRGL